MKIFALLGISCVTACTSRCHCESGFSLARGVTSNSTELGQVEYCMIEIESSLTYAAAKETCQEIGTQLPRVNSDSELYAWSDITSDSWVQAEKRSFNRWRDWQGDRLRDLMWYEDLDDETADEPSRGDKFGYLSHGSVWGASRQAEHPFICAYKIDQFCNRV